MLQRYGLALGIGGAVTFGLLFIMQLLIASGGGGLNEARNLRIVDFVRVDREELIERKQEKPEKPPEPERQPETPRNNNMDNFDNSLAVSMSTPMLSSNVSVGGIGFGVSDGEYLPIVKVSPVYPARAASRGLEGYAIVEYTVTRAGTTRDIRVIESSSSLFERGCVDAATKFKYKPRIIDGEQVEVPGVRNKCTFELEE